MCLSQRERSELYSAAPLGKRRLVSGDLFVGIDLVVQPSHQRLGIWRELMRRTQAEAMHAIEILLAARNAVNSYTNFPFREPSSAWMLDTVKKI